MPNDPKKKHNTWRYYVSITEVSKRILALMEKLKISTFPIDDELKRNDQYLYYAIHSFHGGMEIVAGYMGVPLRPIHAELSALKEEGNDIYLLCKRCFSFHRLSKPIYMDLMKGELKLPMHCREIPCLDKNGNFIRPNIEGSKRGQYLQFQKNDCMCKNYLYLGESLSKIDNELKESIWTGKQKGTKDFIYFDNDKNVMFANISELTDYSYRLLKRKNVDMFRLWNSGKVLFIFHVFDHYYRIVGFIGNGNNINIGIYQRTFIKIVNIMSVEFNYFNLVTSQLMSQIAKSTTFNPLLFSDIFDKDEDCEENQDTLNYANQSIRKVVQLLDNCKRKESATP